VGELIMVKKAFIYARVSHKQQAATGLSLMEQQNRGLQYALDCGYMPAETTNCHKPGCYHDPGVSAWKGSAFTRPGFKALWEAVSPGDTVICRGIDRVARNAAEFFRVLDVFDKKGVSLEFYTGNFDTSTAAGKFMMNLHACYAQLRSDITSERIKEGIAAKKRREGMTVNRGTEQPVKPTRWTYKPKDMEATPWGLAYQKIAAECRLRVTPEKHAKRNIWGYVRVSTSDQSVDSQMHAVRQHMLRLRESEPYRMRDILSDPGESAFTVDLFDRTMGRQLRKMVAPGDHVVIFKTDRAFRSVKDMAFTLDYFKERDITLHFVLDRFRTDNEMGRMMAGCLSMAAQFESEVHSTATKEGVQARMALVGPYTRGGTSPRWLRWIAADRGGYQGVVHHQAVEDWMLIHSLLSSGVVCRKASDAIEAIVAKRENRLMIPRDGANVSPLLSKQPEELSIPERNTVQWYHAYRSGASYGPAMGRGGAPLEYGFVPRRYAFLRTTRFMQGMRRLQLYAENVPEAFGPLGKDLQKLIIEP
jgi:DNA invertase Pin-like site-specific DNA recombinase